MVDLTVWDLVHASWLDDLRLDEFCQPSLDRPSGRQSLDPALVRLRVSYELNPGSFTRSASLAWGSGKPSR
jgi:hypothetical protein